MERRNQPPLVNSSGCFCRVDTDTSVNGARQLVSGPNLRLRSSIKHSVHPSKLKARRADQNCGRCPLLPGLPDDLAIACLIQVPRAEHRKLRLVCKRWFRLLAGNYFYSLRKSLRITEDWVYVIKRDSSRDGRISWDAFDPLRQLWHPLPPVPREYTEALGFGCAVLSGCHLYLFGGKDPVKGSMRRVVFYSARTNRWHRAPDMLRRRYFFGACVINNRLYVAGGESEGMQHNRSLRSAEVYDPNRNQWSLIAEMSTAMVPFVSVVYDGRWFLKGLGPHRQVQSEVYAPETDSWSPVSNGMVMGWRNPSLCLDGKLYGLECKDGCRLRVYDEANDTWDRGGIDSRMHLGGSQAVEAAALVPLLGRVCVVRNNMSISLVDVVGGGGAARRQWETIAGKGQPRTFVGHLWSNIAGRKRLKSHIVHCQVLQA